jgi:hypothetical protein
MVVKTCISTGAAEGKAFPFLILPCVVVLLCKAEVDGV